MKSKYSPHHTLKVCIPNYFYSWNDKTLVSSYINIPVILHFYFGFKFWKKTKIITLSEIPIQHFIDIANENSELSCEANRRLETL
jgi:amino acid permease